MGRIVHKHGAMPTICSHVDTAYANSAARGGKMAEIAEVEIGPSYASLTQLDVDIAKAKKEETAADAALAVAKDKADAEIRRIYDDTWNDTGRQRFGLDAAFVLLFPSGATSYTEGPVEEQPVRMELLARRFEQNLHPKLSPTQHAAAAARVRLARDELKAVLDAAKPAKVKVALLDQTKSTMAKAGQAALMNYKRALKNAGYSEAEIHEVIPDYRRPASAKKSPKVGAQASAQGAGGAAPVAAGPVGVEPVVSGPVVPGPAASDAPAAEAPQG